MKTVETGYKITGTNAERLAISTTSLGQQEIKFYETDTNAEYEWKGSEWAQTKINDIGTEYKRYQPAIPITTYVAATSSVTFASAVNNIDITLPATGSMTSVRFIVDPSATLDADITTLFGSVGGAAVDVEYEVILPGTTISRKYSTGITKISFLSYGAATPIYVGAV